MNSAKRHTDGPPVLSHQVTIEGMDEFFAVNLDLLCVATPDGFFIKVNREFENVLGYKVEELEGRSFLSLIHEDDMVATLDRIKELESQQVVENFINRYRCRDGAYRYMEWRARLYGKYIYASARDITEKKIMEIKLQQTNEELLKLTEELQAANKMLRSLAMLDKLTGLYNRYFFEKKVEEEMERADRSGTVDLSLILFDLDHFKRVNDTWGHPVGDEVLRETAKIAGTMIRKADVLCRIGGEEFAVLMTNTSLAGANIVAEKIREALQNHMHLQAGKVTGSFGVAERVRAESFRRWYKRADDALYQAKNKGRNCIVGYDRAKMPVAEVHLEWRDELISGNQLIDGQHRKILETANRLINMVFSNVQTEKIIQELDALLANIAEHFRTEEQVLERVGYPNVSAHVTLHEGLLQKALYLKQCFERGQIQVSAFFSYIVDDIVLKHLEKEDIQFFPYVKNF